jgi:hypothetical protein
MGFTDMFKAKFDETVAKGKNYATQQFNQHVAPKLNSQMQGMSSAQQTNVDLNDYPEFVQTVIDSIKKSNNNGYLSKIVRSEIEPKTRAILHKIADLPPKQLFGTESVVSVQRGNFYGFKKQGPVTFGGVSTRKRRRGRGKKSRKH